MACWANIAALMASIAIKVKVSFFILINIKLLSCSVKQVVELVETPYKY
mgnify:CR=1 FL=1